MTSERRLARGLSRLSIRRGAPGGGAPRDAQGVRPDDGAAGAPEAIEDRVSQLRAQIAEVIAASRAEAPTPRADARRARAAIEGSTLGVDALPLERREMERGALYLREVELEADHHHGRQAVGEGLTLDGALVARLALDPRFEGLDMSRMLLIDTETTGLGVGAGTIPFLVGIASFVEGALKITQLFLRRPGEEGPMLEALAARIEASSCIVSFNGKSFDWPLLRSRFVINRVAAPSVPPHLDLLHCARRLHRGRLESMRLVALERALLDLHREDDVDGSRIPGIYFDFLQGRQGFAEIEGILTHNGDDLIALAALLAHLGRGFAARDAGGDPEDRLAYALVAERFKDGALAARLALAALDAGAGGASRARALLLLARVARRSDAREEEVGHLLELLAGQGEAALAAPPELLMEAELALAKIYEHHLRDYDRAAEHAARAAPLEGVEASARRQARLARRRGVA